MKKFLLVLLSVLLLTGSVCAQDAAKTHEIVERTYTFYDGTIDDVFEESFPLYFMDGVDDLPYVELESWMELQIKIIREWAGDMHYDLMFNAEGTDAEPQAHDRRGHTRKDLQHARQDAAPRSDGEQASPHEQQRC